MWASLINAISSVSLSTWYGWLTFFAIAFPLLGGICGLGALTLGHKITNLKQASETKVVDDLTASLESRQRELNNARQSAQEARHFSSFLQEKQAAWTLTKEQKEHFISLLQKAPKGRVAVEYLDADKKRSYEFALEIKGILEYCGYQVWKSIPAFPQSSHNPLIGVQVQVKDNQSSTVGNPIQKAFQAIGIETGGLHPRSNTHGEDFVVILIGMKP
jgi:hypothetical protein